MIGDGHNNGGGGGGASTVALSSTPSTFLLVAGGGGGGGILTPGGSGGGSSGGNGGTGAVGGSQTAGSGSGTQLYGSSAAGVQEDGDGGGGGGYWGGAGYPSEGGGGGGGSGFVTNGPSYVSGGFLTATNAGPGLVTISYTVATKVPLTVTGSQTYGGDPTFSVTPSSGTALPSGITVSQNAFSCGTVNGGTHITPTLTAGGVYTIDASSCSGLSLSGTGASNYSIALTGGAFTVNQATQSIQFASTPTNPAFGGTYLVSAQGGDPTIR